MSAKKVVAIVLFILQGISLFGALINGSLYGETNMFVWIGFFLFGIVGGILMYLDYRNKGQISFNKNKLPQISNNETTLNLKKARTIIINALLDYDIYLYDETLLNELLEESSYTRTGKIDKNLLIFNIENKQNGIKTKQALIKNVIKETAENLNKQLSETLFIHIFKEFCESVNEPESLQILSCKEKLEQFAKQLILLHGNANNQNLITEYSENYLGFDKLELYDMINKISFQMDKILLPNEKDRILHLLDIASKDPTYAPALQSKESTAQFVKRLIEANF